MMTKTTGVVHSTKTVLPRALQTLSFTGSCQFSYHYRMSCSPKEGGKKFLSSSQQRGCADCHHALRRYCTQTGTCLLLVLSPLLSRHNCISSLIASAAEQRYWATIQYSTYHTEVLLLTQELTTARLELCIALTCSYGMH